jgi:RNA polymerase sigma-70 factor (ECF subfamily)
MLDDRGAAEEAVQDAFASLWRRADSYRSEACLPRTWLLAIVRHRCIDELRRRRARTAELRSFDAPQPQVDGAWDIAWRRLIGSIVRSALAELPSEQRTAIEFGFYDGYSHSEIAALTGTPLGTVKKRIRSGLRKLKGLVADLAEETAS